MASNRKVKPVDLSAAVEKIMTAYGEDLQENIVAVNISVARATAKKLQQASRQAVGGTGQYAKGWTSKNENTRLTKKAVVYNAATPGLPHLLEFGHVSVVNGRRVGQAKPHPHIQAVEQEAVELYQKEVASKL